MNADRRLPRPRLVVLAVALGLFLVWVVAHLRQLTATQDGWIRFVLTTAFSLLIVLRPKPDRALPPRYATAHLSVLACVPGAACMLMGLILNVQQAEWIGLLLLLWGCLRWSLPASYATDAGLALLLLYWAHPIPGQLFGPLQLAMQRMSVRGTEWLLLALDIRVWADGLVLRTGFSTYEVPAWCSGMRTATTVFLLAWGLAVLNRFRAWECALTIVAALVQALVLNILRIAAMVICVPRIFDVSYLDFLHNTAGLIVIAAVFLVYLEIGALRRYRQRQRTASPPPEERDREIEHAVDWRHLRTVRWAVLGGFILVAALTLAIYRNGPRNRLAVLKQVASAAHDSESHEEALHLAETIVARDPDDAEWHLRTLRLLLTLRRFDDVLSASEHMPALNETQSREREVLRAYALMALDRLDEAAVIVRALPDEIRRANPRVAMILAVMAFRSNDPLGVADNLRLAARWKPNLDRIRLMYPFLRQHRQWETIAETDTTDPHRLPETLFSAAEAFMNLDRPPRVAQLTSRAIARWPGDVRVLEPLYFLTTQRLDSDWELRFREQLRLCADRATDPDALFPLFEKCFRIGRPDLAWHVYKRIAALDPGHPTLSMAVVRYGDQWLSFRRRSLGIPSPTPLNTIDLRPYVQAARHFAAWRPLAEWVPESAALAGDDPLAARQQFLDAALAEFAARAKRGTLSPAMRYLQASALELAARPRDARAVLERMVDELPGEARTARVALSEMYERLGNWPDVYEILRGFGDDPDAGLTPLLRFGRATLNLRLSVIALDTAREIRRRYPRSAQADALLVSALMQSGAPEEALALLDLPRPRHVRELDVLRAQTLFMTQRYAGAEEFCHSALLSRPPIHADTPQRLLLPPAEMAHVWHQFNTPDAAQFARNAAVLRQNTLTLSSPFLKPLIAAWLNAWTAGGTSNTTNLARWESLGRDPAERGLALNQLTILLCHFGRFAEARAAAERATELLPSSAALWRWTVGLSGGDALWVARARAACPDDPELWLAELVGAVRDAPAQVNTVLAAIPTNGVRYPVETLTRAGEFLRRSGHTEAGTALLREATGRAATLLPAYLQGLRCAVDASDREWAADCTREAIAAALRPPTSLYRQMVNIKTASGEPETDVDMVEALKNLRQAEPDNPMWARMLGYVRYKRGGWEVLDAYTQLDAALTAGATNRLTFSIAAEAARQLGNTMRAAEILRQGLALYPDDLEMLNNLAMCLTQTPEGLPEAQALLPRLLAQHAGNPDVLDTVTEIHVAGGNAAAARETITRILAHAAPGTPLWFRTRLHEARLDAATNAYAAALARLEDATRETADLPDEDVVSANRLLSEWRNRLAETQVLPPPNITNVMREPDTAPPPAAP